MQELQFNFFKINKYFVVMDGYINKPITCEDFNDYLKDFINHKNK